jgi:malate/lactate dehydrogenase
MERGDLIAKNITTLLPQAQALDAHAKKNCLVVVVANPANTNALVALSVAASLPSQNFSALTRLDHERLRGLIVEKLRANEGMSELQSSGVHNNNINNNIAQFEQTPHLNPSFLPSPLLV